MIGSVVSCAARMNRKYSETGRAVRRAAEEGMWRLRKLTAVIWNGSAYRIRPRVAPKESWKPTSHKTSGLSTAMTAPTKLKVFKPF